MIAIFLAKLSPIFFFFLEIGFSERKKSREADFSFRLKTLNFGKHAFVLVPDDFFAHLVFKANPDDFSTSANILPNGFNILDDKYNILIKKCRSNK